MEVIQNQFHFSNTSSATHIKEISLVCGNMQYITENVVKIDFKVIEYGCLPGKNSRKKYSGHICSVIYLVQLHTIAKV